MNDYALKLIACSSAADFPSLFDWGQWCRKVATAGLIPAMYYSLDDFAQQIPDEFRPRKPEEVVS